jgi:AraC family L-rhamnose operon regulatory protein RhaS
MHSSAPVFIDKDKTYRADTCVPLRQAVENGQVTLAGIKRGEYPGINIPDGYLPGIRNICMWDIHTNQDWGLGWHRNEGIEITFLENGSLPFEVSPTQRFTLKPNDLTITRPWQPHKVGSPHVSTSRLYWIILDVSVRRPHQEWKWPNWIILSEDDLEELTHMLRKNEQPVWHTNTEMLRCFTEIGSSLIAAMDGTTPSRLAIQINELLMLLLEMFRYRKIPLNRSLTTLSRNVELFLQEIKGNMSEPWTLASMANCCHMGVTRFIHYCVKLTNMTPMEYLNKMRLEKAAQLLAGEPGLKIIDIAFECGFNSSQYFSTLFKQQYKTTPTQYRKHNREETTAPGKEDYRRAGVA